MGTRLASNLNSRDWKQVRGGFSLAANVAGKAVILKMFQIANNVAGAQLGLSHASVGLHPACAGMDKT